MTFHYVIGWDCDWEWGGFFGFQDLGRFCMVPLCENHTGGAEKSIGKSLDQKCISRASKILRKLVFRILFAIFGNFSFIFGKNCMKAQENRLKRPEGQFLKGGRLKYDIWDKFWANFLCKRSTVALVATKKQINAKFELNFGKNQPNRTSGTARRKICLQTPSKAYFLAFSWKTFQFSIAQKFSRKLS